MRNVFANYSSGRDTMKKHISVFILILMSSVSFAQKPKTETDIASLIDNKRFEFVAESANPMRGRTIFLNGNYSVTLAGDSLSSFLPYYGRAYQATIDPGEAGIKFTSTDYEYKVKEKRKGWDVIIKPKDVTQPPMFTISVSKEGYATLRAILVDRQSISFSGYVRKLPNRY